MTSPHLNSNTDGQVADILRAVLGVDIHMPVGRTAILFEHRRRGLDQGVGLEEVHQIPAVVVAGYDNRLEQDHGRSPVEDHHSPVGNLLQREEGALRTLEVDRGAVRHILEEDRQEGHRGQAGVGCTRRSFEEGEDPRRQNGLGLSRL